MTLPLNTDGTKVSVLNLREKLKVRVKAKGSVEAVALKTKAYHGSWNRVDTRSMQLLNWPIR